MGGVSMRGWKLFGCAAVVLVTAGAAPPDDIVRRHDRDDARYVEAGARYESVARVGPGMGDGVLVAPEWILTAAHVAAGMRFRGGGSVEIGGRLFEVVETHIHPEWTEMGPHDMALLRLAEPVDGIPPVVLYDGVEERGRVATIVGHGMHGHGLSGPDGEDGRRRAATNRIADMDDQYLVFVFDEGDDATDLEGTPGPGDSGGPAFAEIGGREVVIGISSKGSDGRNGPGTYGAMDYFGRVSTHIDWIRSTLGVAP